MAMLAEPRRKKKYLLAPRGKALYEDENRYGTKMLEKMGWSKGKGLGRNEDGAKDFVRVQYKNDADGFGYKERDDHWTQHDTEFNGLLKSLNGGNEENMGNVPSNTATEFYKDMEDSKRVGMSKNFSGESLEEKSKKSKVRVHYKKFTRGKDLSQYSKKDLANIFGKKAEEADRLTGIYDELAQVADLNRHEESKEVEVKPYRDTVTTINTGLTVSEYFKQKMDTLRNKAKCTADNEKEPLVSNADGEEENPEPAMPSFKKKKKLKKSANDGPLEISETITKLHKSKKGKNVKGKFLIQGKTESIQGQAPEVAETPKSGSTEEIREKKPKTLKKLKKTLQTKLPYKNYELINNGDDDTSSIPEEKKPLSAHINAEMATSCTNIETNESSNNNKSDAKTDPSIEELIEARNSFNVYSISSFCAEKFRYADLNRFNGSNISQIIGYSLSEDLKLDIRFVKEDEQRINQLWSCTLDKYADARPKKTYGQYVKQAYTARKDKKKIPRLRVKSFKRKHVFGGIL